MTKLKNFFKWIWYNKEQLVSIIYNAVALIAANFVIWTDTINEYIAPVAINTHFSAFAGFIGVDALMLVKIISIVLSVGFAILTVRNICVKYGLSSLETIDKVLAERAAKKQNKLTSEQKKKYKEMITTLKTELKKATADEAEAEAELEKITNVHNVEGSLVPDYVMKKQILERNIESKKAIINNINNKISECKEILNGTKSAPK